ncbi:MAG TPA: 1,4-alpha-glucan branching protein GlgB [Gemmataceae bacterium]|nr:1,4-alpha-glucan branching protein GlgB [Gemmataceae bacterium]
MIEKLYLPATLILEGETLLSEQDMYLFNEGSHYRLYRKLGAHPCTRQGVSGTHFAVWAPAAELVSVIGDFNGWTKDKQRLHPCGCSGIWSGFFPGIGPGTAYKYHIASHHDGYQVEKSDPFAFSMEVPPRTASIVWDLDYHWRDRAWMQQRRQHNSLAAPLSIYEVHLGSWMRVPEENNRPLMYRELAPRLADYVQRMGFTHVEFLPLTEHPFYGSWGYQTTGYFAPTSRYGTPQDFMALVDYLHQRGIGVLLDWVPSHFPSDEHSLGFFDGTHLYEHANPQLGYHPDWNSLIFNYDRHEVRSFLLSSALFWLDRYHIDGLRVDAVASMLYLDYSRKAGEWVPNIYGGNENLGAISFLRRLNEEIYRNYPDVQTIAEESTAWAGVSRPTFLGGLGFGLKWDMGWMHDTLRYFSHDSIHRQYHHNELLFRMIYAFSENFVLSLSHDEVVHGKGSLLAKMPGDDWQKFANLRLLYGYMFGQPGKKLLFMGDEWGQGPEWDHEQSLTWHQLEHPLHAGVQQWVADLNRLYRTESALHDQDCDSRGFEWIDCNDAASSIISFIRKGAFSSETILVVCNFTPVPRQEHAVGVPFGGFWEEVLNSDAPPYGGSGVGNRGGLLAAAAPCHGQPFSLTLTVPPLAVVLFKGTPSSDAPVSPSQFLDK